jgi:hypothetical protein
MKCKHEKIEGAFSLQWKNMWIDRFWLFSPLRLDEQREFLNAAKETKEDQQREQKYWEYRRQLDILYLKKYEEDPLDADIDDDFKEERFNVLRSESGLREINPDDFLPVFCVEDSWKRFSSHSNYEVNVAAITFTNPQ